MGELPLIANIFKWLTLALFACIGAAFFSKPNIGDVLRGTFIPQKSAFLLFALTRATFFAWPSTRFLLLEHLLLEAIDSPRIPCDEAKNQSRPVR